MRITFTKSHKPQTAKGDGPAYEAGKSYTFEGPVAETYARKYIRMGLAELTVEPAEETPAGEAVEQQESEVPADETPTGETSDQQTAQQQPAEETPTGEAEQETAPETTEESANSATGDESQESAKPEEGSKSSRRRKSA